MVMFRGSISVSQLGHTWALGFFNETWSKHKDQEVDLYKSVRRNFSRKVDIHANSTLYFEVISYFSKTHLLHISISIMMFSSPTLDRSLLPLLLLLLLLSTSPSLAHPSRRLHRSLPRPMRSRPGTPRPLPPRHLQHPRHHLRSTRPLHREMHPLRLQRRRRAEHPRNNPHHLHRQHQRHLQQARGPRRPKRHMGGLPPQRMRSRVLATGQIRRRSPGSGRQPLPILDLRRGGDGVFEDRGGDTDDEGAGAQSEPDDACWRCSDDGGGSGGAGARDGV